MKQLFLNKENLIIKKTAQSLLHESSLLVAVHYAYITAQTDITSIETAGSFFTNMPHKVKRALETVTLQTGGAVKDRSVQVMANGYACVGQVIAVGKKVTKFGPGDFVACLDTSYISHTDAVCVPEFYAVKIANHQYLKQATVIPFAAGALQALRRANVQVGEWVGVFGLDIIGLLTVQLARIAGCSVIAVDTDQNCLTLAATLGATTILHSARDEIEKEINLITEHRGLDAVFLTNNEVSLFDHAMKMTRKKGRLVLLSDGVTALHQAQNIMDMNIIVARDIVANEDSCSYTHWTDNRNMRACLSLMENGILSLDAFVEDQVGIEKLLYAYQRIKKKLSVGVLISYEQSAVPDMLTQSSVASIGTAQEEKKFVPATAGELCVGFVGISDVMSTTIIPLIAKMRNVVIKGFFDDDTKKSQELREKYSTESWCSTKQEVMTDDACDVLIIATSHVLHAEQTMQALQQGKAVFLEKPMVTDFQQLEQFVAYLTEYKKVPFCMDYNYSFAPFIKKIKKALQRRRTPLMAHYRLNRDIKYYDRQLVNTTMSAGRIIGDTCQIVDLFCTLTDSFPISVSVNSMHSARDDIFPTDNVTTQITFSDGSVCSFLYTTLGHSDVGTDRLEIYYDGKVIVMEDYMELYGFGLASWFNETVTTPDRGYEALLSQFFNALQQDTFTAPISVDRLQMVAKLTLIIDELACEGGGKKEIQQS